MPSFKCVHIQNYLNFEVFEMISCGDKLDLLEFTSNDVFHTKTLRFFSN